MSLSRPTDSAERQNDRVVDGVIDCVRADVRAMQGYVPGEQHGGFMKLNTNECAYPPAPGVRKVLATLGDDALRLYPDPVGRGLREAAASLYGVGPEQVLVGNGSDDCLTVLFRTFLNPGELIACPRPTYGLYGTLATLQGARVTEIDYQREANAWHLPSSLGASGAKLTLVANPNNPSATLVPVAALRELAVRMASASPSGILLVDEAYVDFATVDDPGASMLPHLDAHPNLVVLRTFSKSYSLAGARLGLMFAAAPLVAEMTKVKDSYNVNAISQALGVAALADHAHHRQAVQRTVEERRRLESGLAAFGWTWPTSRANFLLCSVGPRAGEIYRALKQQRILVRWWDTPLLSESLRITVGLPEQNDALVAALRKIV